MGIIILIISAFIEISFAIYCIATKSNQKKVRSVIRIIAFFTFIMFTLISVIQWSFRWKLLAALLVILTIISVISLIRKKADRKNYKTKNILLKGIAMWLIVVIAATPALIFPQYKLPEMTGKYKVTSSLYTYTDESRIESFKDTNENRKVTIEFWYPVETNDKYPLIVFSHGAFGVSTSNTSTYMELASNGYIVCSISHAYHSMYSIDTDGKLTLGDNSFKQEIIDVNNGVYDKETVYKLEQKWLKLRTEDMNFILDRIINNCEEKDSPDFYQLIDTRKIGLIGHSLGGAAGVQLGRDRDDINAVINLDGDLIGECMGVVDEEYVINDSIYPTPILNIYTDVMKKLYDHVAVSNPDFVNPKDLILSTASDAYEIHIEGTNHLSLTDLPLFSPFLTNIINSSTKNSIVGGEADKYYVIETMNSIILQFFDCYLKNQGEFHTTFN
ncbi:alpha/beta hydrolase family protein [Oceanirhabdus sp. W0125-5]|uniref:alpha/beta hydrolase family protein n=1 Tax=Oceanirhabdus sp. W0125-5 TaxID=2999116 RepID=UPI0022F2D4A9|nr:acetylhydrolase [Oceanirhabdus sp. W0125-5]WBW95842.1 acetylhydrolase [Oceanirhabdus sp. W0125-5]